MRFTIISIGQKMPEWVNEGVETYQTRFVRPCTLTLHELPLEKRAKNQDVAALKLKEAEQIKKCLPPQDFMIALDEHGRQFSTLQLAKQIEDWQHLGKNISFIIGGPDGLDKSILESAQLCWSLSPLTFPHPLVRVLLAEQLYRAMSVIKNHPYHRE
jgi:23S rRNA (pseudouridine1915-N3)-methyltransferase